MNMGGDDDHDGERSGDLAIKLADVPCLDIRSKFGQ